MAYAAHFATDLGSLPPAAQQEIRRVMAQIAEVLDSVPPSNPFWASSRHSVLTIDAAGYRVVYRIEPAPERVVVVEVSPLRR